MEGHVNDDRRSYSELIRANSEGVVGNCQGLSRNNRNNIGGGKQRVVPVAVELGAPDIQGRHVRWADLDTGRTDVRVTVAIDLQSGAGGSGADQVDDGRQAGQRLAAPVPADERAQPVLDPVPLAGAGRQMAYADLEVKLAGELLASVAPPSTTAPGPRWNRRSRR